LLLLHLLLLHLPPCFLLLLQLQHFLQAALPPCWMLLLMLLLVVWHTWSMAARCRCCCHCLLR
jgi:hypothetical protein